MGILDAPDIDSVEEGNRRLASELLDGADLWVFVTSAARYADAVAWTHLEEAAGRGLRVAIVLNRVPTGAQDEVRADLAALARRRGLGDVPIITIAEQELTDGRLPIAAISPLGSFLESIGHDASERAAIVRRSLTGAISSSLAEATRALDGARESYRRLEAAREGIESLVATGAREVASASSNDVLRGEVSARIAEVLGSWDMTRTFARVVGGLRERIWGAVRGTAAPEVQVRRDLTGGLAQRLADTYHRAWDQSLRLAQSVGEAHDLEAVSYTHLRGPQDGRGPGGIRQFLLRAGRSGPPQCGALGVAPGGRGLRGGAYRLGFIDEAVVPTRSGRKLGVTSVPFCGVFRSFCR